MLTQIFKLHGFKMLKLKLEHYVNNIPASCTAIFLLYVQLVHVSNGIKSQSCHRNLQFID